MQDSRSPAHHLQQNNVFTTHATVVVHHVFPRASHSYTSIPLHKPPKKRFRPKSNCYRSNKFHGLVNSIQSMSYCKNKRSKTNPTILGQRSLSENVCSQECCPYRNMTAPVHSPTHFTHPPTHPSAYIQFPERFQCTGQGFTRGDAAGEGSTRHGACWLSKGAQGEADNPIPWSALHTSNVIQ